MNIFRPVPYQFDRLFGPISADQYGDRDLFKAAGIVESWPSRPLRPEEPPPSDSGAAARQAERAPSDQASAAAKPGTTVENDDRYSDGAVTARLEVVEQKVEVTADGSARLLAKRRGQLLNISV